VIRGSDIVPVTDVTLTNIDMWTLNGDKVVHQCYNVFGTGLCAGDDTQTTVSNLATSTTPPAAYTSPASPAWGVSGYGVTIPIPVYTPAAFWSYSAASAQGASSTIASVVATQTSASSASKSWTMVSSFATPTSISSSTMVTETLSATTSDSIFSSSTTQTTIASALSSLYSAIILQPTTLSTSNSYALTTTLIKASHTHHHSVGTSVPAAEALKNIKPEEDDACEW
jgi:rhamnogalacturonan hydrolase